MSAGNNMKYQVKNGIIRRNFLGASRVTLLGASMSGILWNVPSRDENEVVASTLQPDGCKKFFGKRLRTLSLMPVIVFRMEAMLNRLTKVVKEF